ncbi:MAG TPA: antibiotic biosynthesis monooxygenase [Rhodocyclaceae bacterium]|nr:antibiotic biosynthesis monooxygenase [Rhodocyclaceae bacterium]
MFIAMNRFRIARGREAEFVEHWKRRESYLDQVPGFREFHLLEGPAADDHTVFVSHTTWDSERAFADWTGSEAFRRAHAQAGQTPRDFYLGPPQLEFFRAVI